METDTGPTVIMHKWGYFNVENGEMVQESEKWYFDMETCQKEGVAAQPSVDLLQNFSHFRLCLGQTSIRDL